jgi:hypothetical protein
MNRSALEDEALPRPRGEDTAKEEVTMGTFPFSTRTGFDITHSERQLNLNVNPLR